MENSFTLDMTGILVLITYCWVYPNERLNNVSHHQLLDSLGENPDTLLASLKFSLQLLCRPWGPCRPFPKHWWSRNQSQYNRSSSDDFMFHNNFKTWKLLQIAIKVQQTCCLHEPWTLHKHVCCTSVMKKNLLEVNIIRQCSERTKLPFRFTSARKYGC